MLQSITQSQLLPILLAIAAFLVAALLILYIFRLLFGRRIRATGSRNRPRRLDVVDAFDLDRERQLVIVRRDNIEHLLLIGGPNDLLVEGAINRGEAAIARPEPREARPPAPGWPPAPHPAESAEMQPPLREREAAPAQAPFSLDSLKRRIQEPTRGVEPPARGPEPTRAPIPPRPQEPTRPAPPPPPVAPLPPDLFAPTAARQQPPSPEAPPPPTLGSAPRMGGPIFTPRPTAPRPPAPPFLSRTQKVAPPTLKKDMAPPPPAEPTTPVAEPKQEVPPEVQPPAAEAAPSAPETPAPETPPEPEAATPATPAATEPADALESLEAEMARLLGRPEH